LELVEQKGNTGIWRISFFRYANDDDEFVKEFEINQNAWLKNSGEVDEDQILQRIDRRRALDKREAILELFDSNPNVTYSYKDAVDLLKPKIGLQDRQIKTYLSELSTLGKINGSEKGMYRSTNFQIQEGASNE
jgi:hypothetical protein